MNGHATTTNEYANGSLHSSTRKYDVVIVGAGISGINAAYQVQTSLPDSTYTVLEGRHELGGTWSLFKYPGIRSDSDLHTFGFPFNPWSKPNPIASGESILEYLHETVNKFGIDRNIAYGHRVASADWVSAEQLWRLEVDDMQEQDEARRRKIFWARFIVMGTGYYNYETPLKVHIPGIENFKGETIHPQFWPENFDYKGKRIVVIGSGATTITLLPALVEGGVAHVTQLQRSPSFILSVPNPKPGDRPPLLERILPQWIVFRMKRFMNTLLPYVFYRLSQRFPNLIAGFLRREAKRQLPSNISIDPHFKPTYGPFQQRLCLCPDSDYYECFKTGRASIVTDTIKTITSDSIELTSGEKLPADIIVTATGLNLRFCGNINVTVDKQPLNIPSQFLWRYSMLTTVPNLFLIVGYVNASWTLGSDTTCRLFTRLINFMNANKYTSAIPTISEAERKNPQCAMRLSSTYVKSALGILPSVGTSGPWLGRDNYFRDSWNAERADLRKGLRFERKST